MSTVAVPVTEASPASKVSVVSLSSPSLALSALGAAVKV